MTMTDSLSEKDLYLSLKAAISIEAIQDILDVMVQIAAEYIKLGDTQEGADILAYVMRREDTADDIFERADELWEDLARWICPRVLLDAEDFGKKAYLEDVVQYILAD